MKNKELKSLKILHLFLCVRLYGQLFLSAAAFINGIDAYSQFLQILSNLWCAYFFADSLATARERNEVKKMIIGIQK